MSQRRLLKHMTWEQVLGEVDQLHRGGYECVGKWDLSQVCDHLSIPLMEVLEGKFGFKVPWIVKLLGPTVIKRQVLKTRVIREGIRGPQRFVNVVRREESVAVNDFHATVGRFKGYRGPFPRHPVFGNMTPEQWQDIQIVHACHHLGFLLPKQ